MSGNILKKQASILPGQSKLSFISTIKADHLCQKCKGDVPELETQINVISLEIQPEVKNLPKKVSFEIQVVLENKVEAKEIKIQTFKCEESKPQNPKK